MRDRAIRGVVGTALCFVSYYNIGVSTWVDIASGLGGIYIVLSAFFGYCYIYKLVGYSFDK